MSKPEDLPNHDYERCERSQLSCTQQMFGPHCAVCSRYEEEDPHPQNCDPAKHNSLQEASERAELERLQNKFAVRVEPLR